MNRLGAETSPYLLQHAHNPVDWYPWGEEALATARVEDKPILVSIGYAACHWCHVMERESFEKEDIAALMNEHFINIKIDREERPDLDHIYMDAVQAITGSGGWPLNVFLTPEGKPFYGGTYFPPRPVQHMPSWKEVLTGVARSFRERRKEVDEQADHLTRHIATAGNFDIGPDGSGAQGTPTVPFVDAPATDPLFNPGTLGQIKDRLLATADKEEGGFGRAPKFPQSFSIRYLLHYYYFTRDTAALDQACLSLDKMVAGGIYDQLGGGFARYSTDNEWLVPHFEKMLYDNALLVITLSEAYQLTKKERYREVIGQTLEFIDRELSNGQGGFYSALDADSEGIEGKYYVWDRAEIETVLGADAALFCTFYGVTEKGNWEGKNILTAPVGPTPTGPDPVDPTLTGSAPIAPTLTGSDRERLEKARLRLLEYRLRRVRPALDDKILLGWNALMNSAWAKAYSALGEEKYRDRAVANMNFLRQKLKGEGVYYYYHTYNKEKAQFPAFLDDYACLVRALIDLQEITGEGEYLLHAREIVRFVLDHFSDGDSPFFFYTHHEQQDLIVRKKEVYDGATPSGNAVMALNLQYLSVILDETEWRQQALRMGKALSRPITTYPGSFGIWATLFQALTYNIPEVVITGERPESARKEFLQQFIPYRVFQSARQENTQFPLLRGKPVMASPMIFLCKDYACQSPVSEVITLIRLLENVQKFQG